MRLMMVFHAEDASLICALVTDGALQIHISRLDQTIHPFQIVVQALLQHGLTMFGFQPVRHCVETLKIVWHPAIGLFRAAAALRHVCSLP